MKDFKALIRRQIELEDDARALGASRYRNRQLPWKDKVGSDEEEANLPPGQMLLKAMTIPVAEEVKRFVADANEGKAGRRHAAADLLLISDPLEVAYLSSRVLTNCAIAGSGSLAQSAALEIADALIENAEFYAFREVNRVGFKGFMKKQAKLGYSRQRRSAIKKLFNNEGVALAVTFQERVSIGMKCIEMIVTATDLFRLDTASRSKGLAYCVRPTETLTDWFDKQHARCEVLAPINMPMVCRPRRWRSPTYGGYLTPRVGNRMVKQRNAAYHMELANVDMAAVYDSLNHIQDTRWKINTRVLDVLEGVWTSGGVLGGLPQRHDLPLPTKPEDIGDNEDAKLAWKREAAQVYAKNAELVSARMALHQGLWVARKFSAEEAIYFPHEMDFRGRVYPIPVFGPSPQGSDWQKALIHFAEGKPLGDEGAFWLFVHIANLFGVDKVSFEERHRWVRENLTALLDSAENPLDGQRFWTTADSPYSALAACFELAGWVKEGNDFVSRIPIALDGSCSGLQHFSAMLRDEQGGRAVNLLPADKPQDVYTAVAKAAQAVADASTEEYGMCWAGGKVTRSIAKRPTMTFCYSATRFGMQEMIVETLRGLDKEAEERGEPPYLGGVDNYHAATWLSHVLYSSISGTVSAAAVAMDWLRETAKVAASAGLPLWWTTPDGLPILQEYKKQEGVRVNAFWGGQRLRLMIQTDTTSICGRSQINGVAPNFVHSLDAAHLRAVALRSKQNGIRSLALIHDSFGTHAADTGSLSRILRETFIEQYSGNVLQDFYDEIKDQLGSEIAEQLPLPPKMGFMDLTSVMNAEYTFA
ncbi:MAG: T3/T7 RNA polymerase [Verrucomicrobia bacterium]|nr:MAG: T3/T7 RNA polymerase [Verrucomicrobiota bacterium]